MNEEIKIDFYSHFEVFLNLRKGFHHEIGDLFSRQNFLDWVSNDCMQDIKVNATIHENLYTIFFKSEEDKTLFLLEWL